MTETLFPRLRNAIARYPDPPAERSRRPAPLPEALLRA